MLYIVQLGFCLDYHGFNLLHVLFMANFRFMGHNVFTLARVIVI